MKPEDQGSRRDLFSEEERARIQTTAIEQAQAELVVIQRNQRSRAEDMRAFVMQATRRSEALWPYLNATNAR